MDYNDALFMASGHFGEYLPEGFEEMNRDELAEFLEGNTWQPLEGMSGYDLLGSIEILAKEVFEIYNNTWDEAYRDGYRDGRDDAFEEIEEDGV